MKYHHGFPIIGLIILLICITGCTSTAPPISIITPSPSTQPTPIPTVTSCEGDLVSGKYVSVSGMYFDTVGTPDNYATLEINGYNGVLTMPGNVFNMKIAKHKEWTCSMGGYTWTATNPTNSGDLTVYRKNPDSVVVWGDRYFERLNFVKF